MSVLEPNSPLRRILIRATSYAGALLVGAIFAFGYSYAPLHSGKNWKIEHLELRLDQTNIENASLREQLAEAVDENSGKPDGETFKALQNELEQADKTLRELERKLADGAKREKDVARARDQWKKQHAALAAEQAKLAVAPPPPAAAPVAARSPVTNDSFSLSPALSTSRSPSAIAPVASPEAAPAASADERASGSR